MVKSYKDQIVWQKAMDLVVETYRLVESLPREEIYALSDQMRRSAVSIPSNIAEGHTRNSTKEYIQFLSIAKGSNAELQTQLSICSRLGYLSNEQISDAIVISEEVGKMITSIQKKLTLPPNPQSPISTP